MVKKCIKKAVPHVSVKRASRKNALPQGLKGLTESFIGIGIPKVLETQIVLERKGMSGYLLQQGNMLSRSAEQSFKIKL